MSEKPEAQLREYLRLLQCYMRALDAGDLATLAAVLREAEHDRTLERLLLETNEVYQAVDGIAVSPDELARARSMLAGLPEMTADEPASEQAPTATRSRTLFVLPPASGTVVKDKMMIANDPENSLSKPPMKAHEGHRKRTWLQTLAAVLMTAILVGTFLFVFASHHTTKTGSRSTPKSATVNSNLLIETYADSTGGNVIAALQAANGSQVWKFPTFQKNAPIQIVTRNQVVYASTNGYIYALHAQNGKSIWQKKFPFSVAAAIPNETDNSMVFDHGRLYLAGNSVLYALNAQDGTLAWKHAIGDDQAFTVNNGVVYLEISSANAYQPGAVMALRGSDGHFLWSHPANPIFLLAVNNVLYVQAAHQQTPSDQGGNKQSKLLLALNTTTGNQLWSVDVVADGPSNLVFSDNLVILYRTTYQPEAGEFCAYHSNNGKQAWCTSGKQGPWDENTSNYQVSGKTLFVSYVDAQDSSQVQGNASTTVAALDPQTGVASWSKEIPNGGDPLPAVLLASQGVLYVVIDQQLVALRGSDGHILWQLDSRATSLAANS